MSLGATIAALRESVSVQASNIDGAFAEIMDGAAAHEDIKQFLTLTMPLMGHAPLIAAGARALRSRMLRVRVTDTRTGRSKASVQIPLALVDAGLKIGAHFAPEVEGVDMTNVMEALRMGVTGKIIDVTDEEDGEHVEIFVE